ncbi:hypothetical protein BCR33DRAFT_849728 [Rhizoclosmatium globosum]|uniref:Adhesin domain-containing protein n=1 Tax=Rhizoclosmatium globosum TaxID=329046 RepID=A0A1Y2CGE8_9FUNG|nr:hypothetical protein BCR33DRAFT_849728 [Rhizoclosmatium globosum]|eukprot:ORY46133.1 hypothetical protein BCR33DRAFT_849728 [Rhizoclosmatium globosum]
MHAPNQTSTTSTSTSTSTSTASALDPRTESTEPLVPISELTPLLLGRPPTNPPIKVNIKTVIVFLFALLATLTLFAASISPPASTVAGPRFSLPINNFAKIRIETSGHGSASFHILDREMAFNQVVFETEFRFNKDATSRDVNSQVKFTIVPDGDDAAGWSTFTIRVLYEEDRVRENDYTIHVKAIVPKDCDCALRTFELNDRRSDVVWDSKVSVVESFAVNVRMGSVNVSTALNTQRLSLKTEVGAFYLKKLNVLDSVVMDVGTGYISGNIVGYNELEVSAETGEVDLKLQPGKDAISSTNIQVRTGVITARVAGFSGMYEAKTDLGKVDVTTGESGTKLPANGRIGTGNSKSFISAIVSTIGDVILHFV